MPKDSTDFDSWNNTKKQIDKRDSTPYFKEGEIWWVNLGINVGFEIDGKGLSYVRPILIIKKHNLYTFVAIPLSTTTKLNRYVVSFGKVGKREATANLSQIKTLDSRRLVSKICTLNQDLLIEIKRKTSQSLFG